MIKKVLYWGLVAFWLGVIFTFSATNGKASTLQSRSFTGELVTFFDKLAYNLNINKHLKTEEEIMQVVYKINPTMRKVAHITIYGILALLILVALGDFEKHKWRNIAIALLVCFLYALTDEFHQTYVSGRNGTFVDCLVDTIGGVWGCLIYYFIFKMRQKSK